MRRNVLVLVGFLNMILFSTSIFGDTLSVTSGEGIRGTVDHKISVVLNNDVGIVGLQFDLEYDPETFIIEDVDSTDRSEQFDVFVWNPLFPGVVRIIMLDINLDELPPGSGSVADFFVSIANDAHPGTYPLGLAGVQASDSSTAPMDLDTKNGMFEVKVILDSLRVTPGETEMACAQVQAFMATGYDNVGPPIPLDPLWSISPVNLGEIDSNGLLTANKVGLGWVRATYKTWADSVPVEVIHGEPVILDIDPDSATIVSGMQQLFTVTGSDECDNLFDPEVTWTVHPQDLGTIDETGLFSAFTVGSGWIIASSNPSDSAFVVVVTGSLTTIDISPDSANVVCADTLRFSAIGYDAYQNPISIAPDWALTPDSLGAIDSNGLFTAAKSGEGWITAMFNGIIDSAFVTVEPGSLALLDIQPDSVTLLSGQTQQFAALGFDACRNHLAVELEWSVAPEKLGTIDSNGLFTAQAEGEGWVLATGSARDSSYVLVQRGPATILIIAPGEESVVIGDTTAYLAIASDGINTWDVTDETAFSTTDPAGFFSENLYIAGSEGQWEIIGTYSFNTTTLSDTAFVTVILAIVCTRGDVNCDSEITPGDALCAFWRSILGDFQEECSCDCSEEAAEINCDGAITPGDALCIFWHSIQGEWSEECECSPLAKELPAGAVSEIQVGSVRGKPHDVISVPILINNSEGFNAFALHMTYPEHVLEFKNITATTATGDWVALDGAGVESGILSLGGFHTVGITRTYPIAIAEIVFTVKDGVQGGGQFDLTNLVDDLAGAEVKKGNFVVMTTPTAYVLHQNYPNPFNATTEISFQIPDAESSSSSFVSLKIYSILGQEVRTVVNRSMESGYYAVSWDGKDETGQEVSSGIYFYRLNAGDFAATKRLIFMK